MMCAKFGVMGVSMSNVILNYILSKFTRDLKQISEITTLNRSYFSP